MTVRRHPPIRRTPTPQRGRGPHRCRSRADVSPPRPIEGGELGDSIPQVEARTRADWIDFRGKDMQQFVMFLYVLLALSVIVSLFGMVNALVLTVFERTREIGMMRAVGMTRRQVRRMVRHESIITALIGAGLGLPLGLLVAGGLVGALGAPYVVPSQSLVIFTIVAIIAGVLAAIAPARRAAKLNVLQALHYE